MNPYQKLLDSIPGNSWGTKYMPYPKWFDKADAYARKRHKLTQGKKWWLNKYHPDHVAIQLRWAAWLYENAPRLASSQPKDKQERQLSREGKFIGDYTVVQIRKRVKDVIKRTLGITVR